MHFTIENETELVTVANTLLQLKPNAKIFLLSGNLGAGKTALVKAFAKSLGYSGNVQSPTYSLVNEYTINNTTKIYHFDLYRLKNLNEALDIGIEDYLYSSHYCFIEWFEIIENILPNHCIHLNLEAINNKREIEVKEL